MNTRRLAVSLLSGALLCTTASAFAQYGPGGPPRPGYTQGPGYGPGPNQGGWDAPPPGLRDAARQGFQDGMYGAQKDIENRRRPDPNNRDEYRRPNVNRRDRGAYLDGFRQGYWNVIRHANYGGRRFF